jgi:hypothetical protein
VRIFRQRQSTKNDFPKRRGPAKLAPSADGGTPSLSAKSRSKGVARQPIREIPMRLPVLAWSLAMALLCVVASAQAAPSETDTQAAYCLGNSVVAARLLKYPEMSPPNSAPAQRSVEHQLARIERLRSYLKSRDLLADEPSPTIDGFYKLGAFDAAACFGQQLMPGSCYEACAELGSDAKVSACARNCLLPAPCKRAPYCRDIDGRLSP